MSAEEEELRRQLEEQLKSIRVEDVLVQTAVTLVNLAARRLDAGDRDQSKLAIDAIRALLPLCPEDVQAALRDPLAHLQLAWAKPRSEPPPEGTPAEGRPKGDGSERGGDPPGDPPPPSKLWTPGQP